MQFFLAMKVLSLESHVVIGHLNKAITLTHVVKELARSHHESIKVAHINIHDDGQEA
jgi:hypothetical protein